MKSQFQQLNIKFFNWRLISTITALFILIGGVRDCKRFGHLILVCLFANEVKHR